MKEEYAAVCAIIVFIVAFFVAGGLIAHFIDPYESLHTDGGISFLSSLVVGFLVSALFFRIVKKRSS